MTMVKYLILLFLFTVSLSAQPPTNRYTSEIFTGVTETNNVIFSTNIPKPKPGGGFYEFITGYPLNVKEWDTSPVTLRMDVFEPTGDTLSKRPMIIICFGGGFLSGGRDHWSIRLLCQKLARRGFVTAAIDYRLGMNVFDSDLAMRAVYRGVQDGRSAVRYFKADAAGPDTYRVDADNIFIGGHSSGGFIALHNAYLDKEIERPISTYTWSQDGHPVADQLCLDCVGNNLTQNGQAKAVFSLAGAVGFTDFIEGPNDKNLTMFHSLDDDTVPYYSGTPFSSIIWLVVGADLPTVYGSDSIATRGNVVGLNYGFNSYANRGHGVHENGSSALYTDVVPNITSWFFEESLKPIYEIIQGDSIICSNELTQIYSLPIGIGQYFDWTIVGGVFTQMSPLSDTVEVLWDASSATKSISVVPYSALDAKGNLLSLIVEKYGSGNNEYLSVNADWNDPSNWSLGHLPVYCEDVLISNVSNLTTLILDNSAYINSLNLGSNMTLDVMNNGLLNIYQKNTISIIPVLEVQGQINNFGLIEVINKADESEVKIQAGSIQNKASGVFKIGK